MKQNNDNSGFRRIFGSSPRSVPAAEINILRDEHLVGGSRHSILVIDVSPSMRLEDWKPSRLKAAQEAAKAFVKRLASEDPIAKVAIVVYGGKAKLIMGFTDAAKYKKLARSIDSVRTFGSTNITSGLEVALDLAEGSDGLKQVVLITDGEHNSGPSPRGISSRLRQVAVVECIGIGGTPQDVDEELLRYIASAYPDGSKRYRWIGDKQRLVEHFHNLAGRLVRQ
jgi:uncharacterized protein YegL